MACKTVITIGRQYGSGGREIGEKLAAELGVKCYDKELLERAQRKVGCVGSSLRTTMKSLRTAFFIPL